MHLSRLSFEISSFSIIMSPVMEFRPLYFQRDGKIDVKLMGSQPNGDLIYTWKELCQESEDRIITCIGLLQFQNPKLLKFFSLFGEREIIQASLSENGRYVAFIVHASGILDDCQNVEINGIYQAYLAAVSSEPQDVKSCQTVTSCHNFLINCHFLHPLQQNEAKYFTEESPQTEALIVLIHQHSIQVHKFSEESRSEKLMCITESKVLALEFLWCQWIPQHQSLFFLKCIDGMDNAIRYIQDLSYTVLCWVQFYNREEYELMMEIPASCLNLRGQYTIQRQHIYVNAINKISEGRLNLHVIASSQGEIFICHQCFEPEYVDMEECLSSHSSVKSSSDITDSSSFYTASSSHSGMDSTKSYDRESFYSISTKALSINENFCESEVCSTLPVTESEILHSEIDHCFHNIVESHRTKHLMEDDSLYHITVLHSCRRISVSHDKFHSLKHSTLYFFFVEGDNVIAWCPGQFAHLLDTKFCYSPNYCVTELNDDNSLSNYITLKCQAALQTCQLSTGQCLLFVPGIPSIFTVHINIEQLANEISSGKLSSPLASSLDKNLGLIHYISFHSNNAESLLQIMRAISKNPFDPQITDIFKELLLGSALAGVEYDSYWKKHLTQYLTFFILSAFDSKLRRNFVQVGLQHERRYIGEHVIYKELSVISIAKAINRILPVQCSLWNNFCYELKMEFAARLGRTGHFFLFLRHVMAHNRMHTSQKRSIFNGIKQFLTCKKAEDFQLGEAVEFLLTPKNYHSCVDSFQEGRIKMLDALCSELKKRFPQEKPSDIHKVIESYKSHMEIQLYKLICMTFKLFEIRYDSETIDLSLLDSTKQEMLCLFAMLQHLQLASEQLLLSLPSKFHIVQAIIGFKCLSFSTFMQYVYKKMIMLCSASVEYLLKCKDESNASILKKKILICSLPREQAISLLEKWNYCWIVKYHANNLNPIPLDD